MKTYRLNKKEIEERDWAAIFNALERDSTLVKKFIKGARTQKKLPAEDLDSLLGNIGRHVKQYVEVTCSGNVDFF